ncbi:MAG: hypothetical protein Roseis2KO_53460 [Roseivirga sp.]
MSSIIKHSMLVLLLFFSSQLNAQERGGSLPFQTLLDSLKSLDEQRKMEEAIQLGEQLMAEALREKSDYKLLEVNKAMFNVNMHAERYDLFRGNALTCLDLSYKTKDYESVITCATSVALTFFVSSEYDSARNYYHKAMEAARDYLPSKYPVALSNMAFIHGVLDQRDEELRYFMLALKVVEAHPEYEGAVAASAMAYSGLGDYYRSIGEFEKAIENYEGKLRLGLDNDLKRFVYEAHYGLGMTYADENYYDFEKSKLNFEKVTEDKTERFVTYSQRAALGLARLHMTEGNYNEALVLLKEAWAHYSQGSSSDNISIVQKELGDLYYRMGELALSRKWTTQAVSSSRERGVIARERNALKILYRLDSAQGRFKDAFYNYLRYTAINDSLSGEATQNRIKELQIKYDTEQTEKENALLQADLEVQELQSQRQQVTLIFASIISVLLVTSTLIFYRGYRRKKRDHDIIASQKDELKQLSDFKEGLTSMVVHDMKNPINSIIGFSRGTPDEKKMKKINQSGYNILNLVTNMLDIQRFEETRVEVVTEPVEARSMVNAAVNEVHLLLQAKSLRFENKVPKGTVFNVERALLDRVLINLLTNAIKYSGLGTTISVKLGQINKGYQEMIVTDQGEGIVEEKLPYIFNKFWHKDARKSGLAPSTGLGLSFCKLAVEAHGGTIRAESELSLGTSMIFTLPLTVEDAADTLMVEQLQDQLGESLSLAEFRILAEFLSELTSLEVYEVSAINKIISKLEEKGLNKRWLNALQAAVYQGDQSKYNEMLGEPADK